MEWKVILSIALPVILGAVVWFVQSLAQRAWSHYEVKREAYEQVMRHIDSLFTSGDPTERKEYLRAVRRIWLVGSDDVVDAMHSVSESIKNGAPEEHTQALYSRFVQVLRKDLHSNSFLPPRSTKLTPEHFPVEGPGA